MKKKRKKRFVKREREKRSSFTSWLAGRDRISHTYTAVICIMFSSSFFFFQPTFCVRVCVCVWVGCWLKRAEEQRPVNMKFIHKSVWTRWKRSAMRHDTSNQIEIGHTHIYTRMKSEEFGFVVLPFFFFFEQQQRGPGWNSSLKVIHHPFLAWRGSVPIVFLFFSNGTFFERKGKKWNYSTFPFPIWGGRQEKEREKEKLCWIILLLRLIDFLFWVTRIF